jgi:Carboxypeptidase regulatory-like domain
MRLSYVLAALAWCATLASAQSIVVKYHQSTSTPVPGLLSAFSLNEFLVQANVDSGTLTVYGINPGLAHIVVVTDQGNKTMEVQVIPPPLSYPPGFVPPLSEAAAGETGSYESRFTSDPSLSENTVDFMRREGDHFRSFHLAGTFLFTPVPDRSAFAVSSIFYRIVTPQRDVTFFDQLMINSPLTVYESIVRGFHLRQGNLLFHAGYTSIATFENFILPPQKEGVVGVGYRFAASTHASLIPNFYLFPGNHALGNSAQSGTVVSLVYDYELGEDLGLLAEAGYSHGLGAAEQFHFRGARDQLTSSLRYEPIHFASLGANSLHGFYSNVDWTRYLTRRITSTFSFTDNVYNLPALNLSNLISNVDFQFQLSPHWTAVSGITYGRSQSHIPPGPVISVAGVPVGLNFDSRHFQSGFLYQYSKDSGAISNSDEFRATLGTHMGGFRWTGFVDRQTQAMSIAFLSAAPGLQQALTELGTSATTPDQIALALSQTAGLLNQGVIAGIQINVNPVRLQVSNDLTWSNHAMSRQQFDFRVLYNKNELLQGENGATIGTFSYSLKFKRVNEFSSSISVLRDGNRSGESTPLFAISLRHQVSSAPNFIISRRRGTIAGVVFADDGAVGTYRAGAPPLPDVEVILDDKRRTRTDRSGHYRFAGVTYGSHSVEAVYQSANPFFYTTASRVQSEINEEINFGIGLAFGRIFGTVQSDTGTGLAGVEIGVSQGPHRTRAQTDSKGEFRVEGLSSGQYEVKLDADSVPPGYSFAGLETERASVNPSVPGRSSFTLNAIRNVSGRIAIFDRASQQEIPVPKTAVRIRELSLESITDQNGIYLFRNLPAGSYSLVVVYQGKESMRTVTLPDAPGFPQGIDFNLVAK